MADPSTTTNTPANGDESATHVDAFSAEQASAIDLDDPLGLIRALPAALADAPRPTWEMARFYPRQGAWTEADYFELPDNRRTELRQGRIELLPMPTLLHQRILAHVLKAIAAYIKERGAEAEVLPAGTVVRLWAGQLREPDVVYFRPQRVDGDVCDGADLVVEVASPGTANRTRDLVDKRTDYARAGIPEYWVVDPKEQTISVFTLSEADRQRAETARAATTPKQALEMAYAEPRVYTPGEAAASVTLDGFALEVASALKGTE